jgi:simple sugar transport system substrate-binding protein
MKKFLIIVVVLMLSIPLVLLAAGKKESGAAAPEKKGAKDQYEIVLVVKLEGIAWFDDMRRGMQAFDADHPDVNAYQVGADTADPAAQVAIIEDLVAKGVDAILCTPNSPESLVPVFKKAREAGIIIVTHEAPTQKEADASLEAFHNEMLGYKIMDTVAEDLGGKGDWVRFVGFLSSPTHNVWADAEEQRAKEKYPGMKMVAQRLEDEENQRIAYDKTLELMRTYPDLDAIIGIASSVAGAAQAVKEKGMAGKVGVYGSSLPSMVGEYIEDGIINSVFFWRPKDSAYATANVAYKMLKGEEITPGMDLGAPGYTDVTIEENEYGVMLIYGSALTEVNKDNLDTFKDANGEWML